MKNPKCNNEMEKGVLFNGGLGWKSSDSSVAKIKKHWLFGRGQNRAVFEKIEC